MREPGPRTYLVGHPVSVFALAALVAALAYQSWLTPAELHWLVPLLALGVLGKALEAKKLVERYRQFDADREQVLDGGKGVAARKRAAKRDRRTVGIFLWLVYGYWLTTPEARTSPYLMTLVLVFVLPGVALLYQFIAWLRRRRPRTATATAAATHIVTTPLPLLTHPPQAHAIAPLLPSYCRSLLTPVPGVPATGDD